MSGFNPCVPFMPFSGVGGRQAPANFSDDNFLPEMHPDPTPYAGPPPDPDPKPSIESTVKGSGVGYFKGFKNTYETNPIGALQERLQKQGITPVYEVLNTRGYDLRRVYSTQCDGWIDYDNLSGDSDEDEQEREEISEAINSYLNKDEHQPVETSNQEPTRTGEHLHGDGEHSAELNDHACNSTSEAKEQENLQHLQDETNKFYNEINQIQSEAPAPKDHRFGLYRKDQYGNMIQVGFGDEDFPEDDDDDSEEEEDQQFNAGWGQSFQSGFGNFLHPSRQSQYPLGAGALPLQPGPSYGQPMIVSFGRGGARTGARASQSLPPQEALWGQLKRNNVEEVTLPNGLQAIGHGPTKKLSKHNTARAMLDILDGSHKVTEQVSQSISDGLKALRGEGDSSRDRRSSGRDSRDRDRDSERHGHKTFKPSYVCKPSEQEYLESQKKHQEEVLKQSIEYGPLGVKLWFTGESKNKEIQCTPSSSTNPYNPEPNQPPDWQDHADERMEGITKGQFFIKGPVHNETMEDFLEKLIFETAWLEIIKRSGQMDSDNVCKLCNLVFISKKHLEEHKYTDDHLHVCKGYFPGKGGYHCFLCWISFNQPEGLLNHISRENHQKRATRKGVLKIWMEPVTNTSWDLINVHKHLEDCRREDASKDWKTRDEARRDKERRRSRSRDRKRGRSRSPDKWSHDKYEEPSRRTEREAREYYKWREVKDEKRRRHSDETERHRERSHSHREESWVREEYSRDRHERGQYSREDRDRGYRDPHSSHREERDRGFRDAQPSRESSAYPESNADLRDMLRDRRKDRDYDDGEGSSKHRKKSRDKGDKKRKRSKRDSELSDHEEVNETRVDDNDDEGENGEETLQKMKSAIISVLDDEIFALSNKKSKRK